MIISCDQCHKKFEIDSSLIPKDGRLLECGSCNHKWFYKQHIEDKTEEIIIEPQLKNLNIYLVKLSAYDFFIIFLSLGTIISNSILFLFAYSIANSLVENSNFNSFKVSVELSHPIKGSIPESFV